VSFIAIFLAVSAVASSRSTAMAGAFGAYFLLVPFWIGLLSPVGLDTLLTAVGDLLGTTVDESTREFVRSLSPYGAYGRVTQPVFADAADRYDLFHEVVRNDLHDRLWFNGLVLAAWTLGSTAVAYLSFRRSELA